MFSPDLPGLQKTFTSFQTMSFPDIHAKPPGLHLAAVKSCRNLSHSKPILLSSWALTSPHRFTEWHHDLWTECSPPHCRVIQSHLYIPNIFLSQRTSQKGEGKDLPDRHTSAGKPDQLNINNVPVAPWPHVMSKALKTSPELISRTPEEKSYNTPDLSTPQNVKVMENNKIWETVTT